MLYAWLSMLLLLLLLEVLLLASRPAAHSDRAEKPLVVMCVGEILRGLLAPPPHTTKKRQGTSRGKVGRRTRETEETKNYIAGCVRGSLGLTAFV
jgi:hypothetical protein